MTLVNDTERQVLDRLREAIDSHDPARVAACFTEDFSAELPHHPGRSFTGNQRVLENWTNIFASAPDVCAAVLRWAISGDELWSEWELFEPSTDGHVVRFAGPVVMTVRDGRIATARFYLDAVDDSV
jgi:ketosteroid isomerase-like protein